MTETIAISVCICTFRRLHIVDTLRSLARLQREPYWELHIIVADNDDTPSARGRVEQAAAENGLPLTYLHAPARNISIARNACLDVATTGLVAFIDDDERVTPGWLAAMLTAIENSAADVVLGPVTALYDPQCPVWMRNADFHSTLPVWVGHNIITGYSCNVMFRSHSPALQGLRFREDFGQSGGEDTAFFTSVVKAGGVIAFAPEAIVTEEVTGERARLGWLLKRRFRSGQTHGQLLVENSAGGGKMRVEHIVTATAKSCFCFIGACLYAMRPERRHFWLLRGALHAGAVSRLLGKKVIKQYG